MKIRTASWVFSGGLALLVALMGGEKVLTVAQERASDQEAALFARARTSLDKASSKLALERSLTQILLGADASPAAIRAMLEARRVEVDEAFARVRQDAATLPEAADIVRLIDQQIAALAQVRAEVAARPRTELANAFDERIEALVALAAKINPRRGAINAETQALARLAETSLLLHENSSADATILALAADSALTPEQIARAEIESSHADLAWAQIEALAEGTELSAPMRAALEAASAQLNGDYGPARDRQFESGGQAMDLMAFVTRSTQALDSIESLAAASGVAMDQSLAEERADHDLALLIAVIQALFGLGLVAAIYWFLNARVVRRLEAARAAIDRLAGGEITLDLAPLAGADEVGEIGERLAVLASAAEHAFRAEAAVRDASVSFLISDAQGKIVFINEAFQRVLTARRDEIAKHIPGFDPDRLLGADMDVFHARPGVQRSLTAGLTGTHQAQVRLGEALFELTLWPVAGKDGARLGAVLQWVDRTNERAIESEVQRVVACAAEGDFSERISLAGKTGFMRTLAERINTLSASVEEGLGEADRVLSAIAKGDLTARFETDARGRFHSLKQSANSLAETMAAVASRIGAACDSLLTATREIAAGASDLSGRTERQAASVQETAASMEELAATVRATAANARTAAAISGEAETAASEGGAVVSQAVVAMSRIEDGARRITEITGLIEEIAFQTNLLALNAAVEAARAGEAGRGFAVVASEVRALAQRAAGASREIKDLIVRSNGEVQSGVTLVRQAGDGLSNIVERVRRANAVIADISSAAAEQAQGVEEANIAVSSLDQITQQNAALVEETTAALESTRAQVEDLASVVSFFQTNLRTPAPQRMRARA